MTWPPSSARECPPPEYASFCLTLKEYQPSRQDDADANLNDNAGMLTFFARTCAQYNVGDKCITRMKKGTSHAVTVCRSHCNHDGCNSVAKMSSDYWQITFFAFFGSFFGKFGNFFGNF